MTQNRSPRKELLPLAPTQLKLAAVVCLPLVLSCVVVAFWQTYFFLTSLRSSGALQGALARQVLITSGLIAAITLVVMVPVFFAVAVWVSYRIVGPMRRLAAELTSIGAGRVCGGFWFRKGDELAFVAEAVSDMKRGLREKLVACLEAMEKVEQAADADRNEALKGALAELRARLDAFSTQEVTPSDR